ncbi:YbaB/EbfC family nucleoid-associated protein [Mangrovihabitans endophyticus]|uniref:YbaB/EbfC DNA-binding family protein n=1 Tax=Mangrovihabitans endophyticus TaxID=1751298 RepID=A0A8J3FMU1_9ACTN|nr:YbaB/EbfC family nucleoid-associated protein [Mangrovihabitans endophyticus]GGK86853.1 hypothetical protein GCM10012284_21260 [Mangrovihabitans endophyticus]
MSGHEWDDAPEQDQGRTEAAAALADRVAALVSTASGADGAIRVTVVGSGSLAGLELDDSVHRLPGADLAAAILHTVRRAQAGLAERAAAAVEETVGAESATGKAVLDSFAQRFPAEPDGPAAGILPPPPPFPTFQSRPSLPHQAPGVGYESGRDSRAR